jgi:hypothetical protein
MPQCTSCGRGIVVMPRDQASWSKDRRTIPCCSNSRATVDFSGADPTAHEDDPSHGRHSRRLGRSLLRAARPETGLVSYAQNIHIRNDEPVGPGSTHAGADRRISRAV